MENTSTFHAPTARLPTSTKTTRLLIISDTHAQMPSAPLPSADVLLHCGDLTNCGSTDELEKALSLLESIDGELKLVIAGNHDTTLDHEYCSGGHGQEPLFDYTSDPRLDPVKAMSMWKERTAAAGIHYLEEGTHTFRLKSGVEFTVYATPYQPSSGNWAFGYREHQDRYNAPGMSLTDARNISKNPIPDGVHIVMSHGPMLNVLDRSSRGENAGCAHLLRAVMRTKPLLHVCGHIHEAYGGRRITWSPDASEIAAEASSIREWSRSVPRRGARTMAVVRGETSDEGDALKSHASYVNFGQSSAKPLRYGQETVALNASLMDAAHNLVRAPWLVDVELPLAA